jgi:maleate cis-trans isomerase
VIAAGHRDFSRFSADPREWYETNRQPLSTAYSMVREVDRDSANGVLIAATNFPTLQVLQQAEDDLGKPVVSCNQSILWWCLRELGIQQPISGFGVLLKGDPQMVGQR